MKIIHYAVVLGLICTLAAFGVAGVYRATSEKIEAKSDAAKEQARSEVVAASDGEKATFTVMNPDADSADQVVQASNGAGQSLGYAALGQAQGYGGMVKVMVGMDANAERIIGVKVVEQKETPGLGTRVAEVKSSQTWFGVLTGKAPEGETETMPEFLKQFMGREQSNVKLGGEDGIQAITGATISSTAVTNAVRDAATRIRAEAIGENESQANTGATEEW